MCAAVSGAMIWLPTSASRRSRGGGAPVSGSRRRRRQAPRVVSPGSGAGLRAGVRRGVCHGACVFCLSETSTEIEKSTAGIDVCFSHPQTSRSNFPVKLPAHQPITWS